MSSFQVKIEHLSKKYGKKIIINQLSLCLDSENYTFIQGANGSGKSTLVKCLCNLVPYQGTIDKGNHQISYCPEKVVLPEYLSIYEFLFLMGMVKNIPLLTVKERIHHYLKLFSIEQYQQRRLNQLSLGTRQKVLIINALIDCQDIYIFDEPLNGLDATSAPLFIEELKRLKKDGKMIIISTHHPAVYQFENTLIIRMEDYHD